MRKKLMIPARSALPAVVLEAARAAAARYARGSRFCEARENPRGANALSSMRVQRP